MIGKHELVTAVEAAYGEQEIAVEVLEGGDFRDVLVDVIAAGETVATARHNRLILPDIGKLRCVVVRPAITVTDAEGVVVPPIIPTAEEALSTVAMFEKHDMKIDRYAQFGKVGRIMTYMSDLVELGTVTYPLRNGKLLPQVIDRRVEDGATILVYLDGTILSAGERRVA